MLNVANAIAITWTSVSNVWIDGLQIGKSSESAHYQDCIQGSGTVTASTNWFVVSNTIGRQAKNNSYRTMFIDCEVANQKIYLINCIDYNHGTAANAYNCSVFVGNGDCYCYSCTFIGGYEGVNDDTGGTFVCKNCYARGSSAAYTGVPTMTNCASSDATSAGTDPHDNVALDNDTFVDSYGQLPSCRRRGLSTTGSRGQHEW